MFIPDDAANYNTANATVFINVYKATPVIEWENPSDIDYGTPLNYTHLNPEANIPGTYVYTPDFGAILPVGNSQPLRADFSPRDTMNYIPFSKTVLINVLLGTGMTSEAMGNIRLYPNPATEGFRLDGITGSVTVSLVDVSGKLLFTKEVVGNEYVPLTTIEDGLYIVRITTANGEVQRKMIKK